MSSSETIEIISIRDGRRSLEHLLDVDVLDLFDSHENQSPEKLPPNQPLSNIQFLMETRVKGGQQPNFEYPLMKRLLEALLIYMRQTHGKLLNKKFTYEANLALRLFGEFLQEVNEFRQAVGEKSVSELKYSLKFHRRCRLNDKSQQTATSLAILAMLITHFPQFSDWKDLVRESHHKEMDQLLKDFSPNDVKMPPPSYQILPPQALYSDREPEKVLDMFQVYLSEGLKNDKIDDLRQFYGTNQIPKPPSASILKMLIAQLTDFMVLVLLAATIATAAQGDFKATSVLAVVIILNTVIGFTQEFKASKALSALEKLNVPTAQVIRDNDISIIPSEELVPGDLVVLEEGDSVPADLRLVEVSQLEIVESILTGESIPVCKEIKSLKNTNRSIPIGDCKNNAFMSTLVSRGRAKGLVVRVGEKTEIGMISSAISKAPKIRTPLQKRLDKLGKILVVIALVLCALIVGIGVAWKRDAVKMVIIGFSLAVSVIPEGLVAVVTITLALAVRRMAKRNAIVRTLPSVETLGSVTAICSDKTGTLTEGKMGATILWSAEDVSYEFTESTNLDTTKGHVALSATEKSPNPIPLDRNMSTHPPLLALSAMISSLCNNASIKFDEETPKAVGDPTEVALEASSQRIGFFKEHWKEASKSSLLHENAFDSERKMMSVVYQCEESDDCFVFVKGAPEEIIAKCSRVALPSVLSSHEPPITVKDFDSDNTAQITSDFIDRIEDQNVHMAKKGLRVLALAMKKISILHCKDDPEIPTPYSSEYLESDLVFVSLIGLIDPPRQGVSSSVRKCKEAGIRVIMITGDHIATASAIATQIGIIEPMNPELNRSIRGAELDLLSDEDIVDLNPFPVVFARVSPENKLKIVQALQKIGHCVAMTGDGVNDAPAIKTADVGVAMGIAGTEITKQAANIVLSNDDFSTIVAAVEEGRQVFDNILKFIIYLLSCNAAEIIIMLLSAAINIELPFTIIMILWANIIADVPPSLSLGLEPAEKNIMSRPPRNPSEGVLTWLSSTLIILQALFMSLISFTAFIVALKVENLPTAEARTLAFTMLTTLQLAQSLLSRSIIGSIFSLDFFSNVYILIAFWTSFGLLCLGIYWPAMASWLELVPLSGLSWIKIAASVVLLFCLSESLKMVLRSLNKKNYSSVLSIEDYHRAKRMKEGAWRSVL